jgi:hypothetical protein
MSTVSNVLILGAGASVDFGFPSGPRLLEDICAFDDARIKYLIDCGCKEGNARKFIGALRDSHILSVDRFLEINDEFLTVGKTAIAAVLLEYEKASAITEKRTENWYRLLLNELIDRGGAFPRVPLKVVTFNYDRSLEEYLFRTLPHIYTGKSELAYAQYVAQLSIYHIYGSLGTLPEQECYEKRSRVVGYGKCGDANATKLAAESIILQPETSREIGLGFSSARDIICDAYNVFFLGFGYDLTNVNRLGARCLEKATGGTAYELQYARRSHIERVSGGKLSMRAGNLIDEKVFPFLYNHVNFDVGGDIALQVGHT